MVNKLLISAETLITSAYKELGHDQGWSFLYTPGSTLVGSKFLFMGLNPGGKNDREAAELTTEAGNAYNPEIEDWSSDGKGNHLQRQIVSLYKILSDRIGFDYRKLMDTTLAANFCPFRSKSWEELTNQEQTISFCNKLWSELFGNTQITTILCMSSLVHQYMSSIIVEKGGQLVRTETDEIGWGKVTYQVTHFKINGRDILIIRLPHLSRYKIFGRKESCAQIDKIVNLIASSLNGWLS